MLCLTRRVNERLFIDSCNELPDEQLNAAIEEITAFFDSCTLGALAQSSPFDNAAIRAILRRYLQRKNDRITVILRPGHGVLRACLGVEAPPAYHIVREEIEDQPDTRKET